MSATIPPRDEDIDRRESVVVREAGAEPVVGTPLVETPMAAQRQRVSVDYAAERAAGLGRVNGIIWFIAGTIAVLIGLRVVLRLIAANPTNPFAQFIYGVTGPLVAPFNGLTGTPTLEGAALEISSLVALVVYMLVAWGLTRLMHLLLDRPSTREVSTTSYRRDV